MRVHFFTDLPLCHARILAVRPSDGQNLSLFALTYIELRYIVFCDGMMLHHAEPVF